MVLETVINIQISPKTIVLLETAMDFEKKKELINLRLLA